MKKILKFFLLFIFLCILTVLIISGIYLYKLNSELPSVSELKNYNYKTPTTIYDAEKKVIAELGDELRYPVSFEKCQRI